MLPTLNAATAMACQRLQAVSDSALLDAEVLLATVLAKNRSYLRAWPEQRLQPEQWQRYQEQIEARASGKPVAYLTGSREFWSREFSVSPAVLIPRPETELLVELALERIGKRPLRIADLGTGSGAIAVTLAAECPWTRVLACDLSTDALAIARQNADRHRVRIDFCRCDWLRAFAPNSFDLIVSNPPYIAAADPHLTQGDVRCEPVQALVAGADGLEAIRPLIRQAATVLMPGGTLLIEHGFQQGPAVRALLRQADFIGIESVTDLQGHPRVSLGQRPGQPVRD